MKWRKGPRPWTIHAFAAIFLATGFIDLIRGLSSVGNYNFAGFNPFTGERLSDDAVIVMVSAGFTIVCIPVVAIWLFGNNIARWIVTLFTLWGVVSFGMHLDERYVAVLLEHSGAVWSLIPKIATWVGVLMLFLPASRSWFARKQEVEHAIFE